MTTRLILLLLGLSCICLPGEVADVSQTAVPRIYLPLILTPEPVSGLAWHNRRPADAAVLGGVEWYYTYGLRPYRNEPAQFVPMLWCDRWPAYDYVDGYDYIQEARPLYPLDYRGYFLFLNEPDLPGSDRDGGQCGMTPLQAAHFYKSVVALWPDAKFVGPAVSHMDYWREWEWLAEWYRLIVGMGLPLPHAAALHTYLSEPPPLIVDSLFAMLARYPGAPTAVWITEFGSCDPAQVGVMLDAFRADGRVSRYAYFSTRATGCTDLFYDIPGYSLTRAGEVWVEEHQ